MNTRKPDFSDFERDQMRIRELNQRAMQQKARLDEIKARQAAQIAAIETLLSGERAPAQPFAEPGLRAG